MSAVTKYFWKDIILSSFRNQRIQENHYKNLDIALLAEWLFINELNASQI